MKKTIKVLIPVIVVAVLLTAFASCDLFGSSYVIRIDNTRHWQSMDTYYRVNGETEWQELRLGVPSGYEYYVEIDEGIYDFSAVPSGWSGPDAYTGADVVESVEIDYQYNWDDESQSYDYTFNIFSDTSISVY